MRKIATSFYGEYRRLTVFAMTTGMGGVRAAEWLSRVVRDVNPQLVMLVGFAGALKPELKPGDIIQPAGIIDEAGRAWQLRVSPPLPPLRVDRSEISGPLLLTTQRPALTPEEKQRLRQTFAVPAVDNESAEVAERAIGAELPLVVVRAISDTVTDVIPPSVMDWIDGAGHCRRAAAVDGIARRPWILPTLMRLQRQSGIAGEALAQRVKGLLDGIASDAPSQDFQP